MRINSYRFSQALNDFDVSAFVLAKRMRHKHGYGSQSTIQGWIKNGGANKEAFELAIDTLNEYVSDKGWRVHKISPYKVEDFTL